MSVFSTKKSRLAWSLAVMKRNKLDKLFFYVVHKNRFTGFAHHLEGDKSVEKLMMPLNKDACFTTGEQTFHKLLEASTINGEN